MGYLSSLLSHLTALKIHHFSDDSAALIPDGPFGSDELPVVVFSHGLGGSPDLYVTAIQVH